MILMKIKFVLLSFGFVLLLSLATSVKAEDSLRGGDDRGSDDRTETPEARLIKTERRLESSESSSRSDRDEGKLRSCQARESAVQTRMGSLVKLTEKMLGTFDSIADKVKKFYTDKVLPTGKSVPNYDELVEEIANKRVMVVANLAAAQGKTDDFSCELDDPKEHLTNFREDMQDLKSDLKEYRTAIKNLIKAVRKLVSEDSLKPSESPESSRSPEPSETPEATTAP